ncbi:pYEATS domain-containing protein [Methylobacterium brachiatum]|uniref:pYEATS domain-containing protein n=1 Tax=Methylobacterium brachiatum TaxID=269660 RepID=UPI0008DFE51C|nr:pYEATS domain-containing protein [Methylobacterium brachiatum]SFJ38611.1 hypothetical protein SAMN02799642_04252 [Methylobacterium brachiatum]
MSKSEDSGKKGTLRVEAPIGMEISIANGAFREVANGVTRLSTDLDDGVYTVRTSASGRSQQRIVRVRSGEKVELGTEFQYGDGLDEALLDETQAALMPGDVSETRAGIAVLVVGPVRNGFPRSLRPRMLRIVGGRFGFRYGKVAALGRPLTLGRGSTLFFGHSLAPGTYSLAFRTFDRRIVRQAVYLAEGRITVVVLRFGSTAAVADGSVEPRIWTASGFDPSRTVITSVRSRGSRRELAGDVYLAEMLLHRLRTRARGMDPGLVEELARTTDNPFLELYGATAALASTGQPLERLAAALNGSSMESPETLEVAEALGERLRPYDAWSDVRCLLNRLRPSHQDARPLAVFLPPTLEISWRWASAASTAAGGEYMVHPDLVRRAEQAEPSASPWFVLGRRVPVHASTGVHSAISAELGAALGSVTGLLASAIDGGLTIVGSSPTQTSRLDLGTLSPSSDRIVRAVLATGEAGRQPGIVDKFVGHLAASLAIPASALGPALVTAAFEVGEAVKRLSASSQDVWKTDPHKGRFGGSPVTGHASVRLESFDQREGMDFLGLNILVEGRAVRGPVTFYLHPTFNPSTQRLFATGGIARLHIYAWGAFTLGVELANKVKLELDLAQLAELPKWFRIR